MRRSRANTSAEEAVSRLPVGSSASTSGGFMTSARAMATRCCMPPDSSAGRLFMAWARPTASSRLRAWSRCARLTRPSAMRAGNVTFSSAENAGSRWWNWNTKPSVLRRRRVRAASSRPCTSSPSSRKLPEVMRSSKPRMLSKVLLPEPEGPISAMNSPRRTCRLMPCSTSASLGRPRL